MINTQIRSTALIASHALESWPITTAKRNVQDHAPLK